MTIQNSHISYLMSSKNKMSYKYTDENLILKFQQGDLNAYNELVNRYQNKLLNFIYYYVGNLELAEDVVQDTMIRLYNKKHYYREIAKFSTWIYTIAKNIANTELRKKKRKGIVSLSNLTKNDKDYEIVSTYNSPEHDIEAEFTNLKIRKAINNLSEKYLDVIILRDIESKTYEEIAYLINLPIGTVKSRINRGRIKLQQELKSLKKEY